MRAVQRVFSRRFGVASNMGPDAGLMPGATPKSMATVDLNFSLAADKVTTRGDTFRNADVRTLIEHIPKGAAEVKKGRVVSHAGASSSATPIGATDALPGSSSVVDVDSFEAQFKAVVDDKLGFAPQLFVQDGAFGSSRGTEIRTRVIADCPVMGLAARALLHRVPLYAPQVFPRAITVYAATRRYGWMGSAAQQPRLIVDVDPATSRASILIWGDANAHDLTRAVAVAANALNASGGAYRSLPGGSQDPNLSAARSDGSLAHYLRDGHFYPAVGEPQPDVLLLPPRAATVVGAAGAAPTVILGADATSSIATAAAASGKLLSSGSALWHATEGVSSSFAAALVASEAASSYKALPEGTVLQKAGAVVPWAASGVKSFGKPSRVLVIGGSGDASEAAAGAVASAAGWAGLGDKAKAQLKSRLTAAGVTVEIVKDAKAAADAIASAAK